LIRRSRFYLFFKIAITVPVSENDAYQSVTVTRQHTSRTVTHSGSALQGFTHHIEALQHQIACATDVREHFQNAQCTNRETL